QLRAAGQEVALLALFDSYGPGFPRVRPLPRRLAQHARRVVALGPTAGVGYLAERCGAAARRLGPKRHAAAPARGRPAEPAFAAVQEAHRRASRRYRPRPYPGRVALFRAAERPDVIGLDYGDPLLGW